MEPQLGDVSDDGYWVLTESGWEASYKQKQALEEVAIPYQFTDSIDPDYEWWHKYEIKGKVISIMPLDENDELIDGACIAMVEEGYDFYEEYEKVSDPSWCTYD